MPPAKIIRKTLIGWPPRVDTHSESDSCDCALSRHVKDSGVPFMTWLRRHAAWAWPAMLVAGLALVVAIRLGSEWANPQASTAATESQGLVVGDSDPLAAAGRRLRLLQQETGQIRDQLAAIQNDVTVRREQAAAIDEMLSAGRLTDCPPFLQEDTTVRALQKIIREATASDGPETTVQGPLSTAAAVARQRLRRKLEVLRDQRLQESAGLDAQAETLRAQLRLQTQELQRLQNEVQRQLQQSRGHPSLLTMPASS